jgi:hypothetical protein
MSQTRRMKSTGRPAPSSSRTAARLSLLACAKQRLEVSRRTPSMIATPCHQGFHRLGMGQAHEPAAGRDQPLARLHVSFRRERPGQRSNPDLEVLAAVEVGPGRRTTRIERSAMATTALPGPSPQASRRSSTPCVITQTRPPPSSPTLPASAAPPPPRPSPRSRPGVESPGSAARPRAARRPRIAGRWPPILAPSTCPRRAAGRQRDACDRAGRRNQDPG